MPAICAKALVKIPGSGRGGRTMGNNAKRDPATP